jgi:hypothetical protein
VQAATTWFSLRNLGSSSYFFSMLKMLLLSLVAKKWVGTEPKESIMVSEG